MLLPDQPDSGQGNSRSLNQWPELWALLAGTRTRTSTSTGQLCCPTIREHSLEHSGESRDPPAPAPAVADEAAETSAVCRLLRGQRRHVTAHSPSSCQHPAGQPMGLMSCHWYPSSDQVSHLWRKSCSQPPAGKPRINSSLECQLVFLILLLKHVWVDWEGSSRTGQQQRRKRKTRNYFI